MGLSLYADCADSAYKCFQDIFVNLYEMHFPLVNTRIIYSNKLPWLTNGLRKSVKRKSNLRRMMEKDPSPSNITNYKKHRNLLTSPMRKRHKEDLQEQLELSNPIKKWKIMKDIKINKTNCYKNSTSELFINGSICNDPQVIANAYNDYFVEVGPTLANNISD